MLSFLKLLFLSFGMIRSRESLQSDEYAVEAVCEGSPGFCTLL